MTDTLTPEELEAIRGRAASTREEFGDQLESCESDREVLLSALDAAIERAERAEGAVSVWRRAAASGLCRAGIATPVNLAEDFHPSDLTHGMQKMQSDLTALKARLEELEGAAKEVARMLEMSLTSANAVAPSRVTLHITRAKQGAEKLRAAMRAHGATLPLVGEWRDIETNYALKGRCRSPAYFPATGEVCEVSGPNCDDDNGYAWLEVEILWQNDLFVLYGVKGHWPNLNKREHIAIRPLKKEPGNDAG